jgi:hypothetical protein
MNELTRSQAQLLRRLGRTQRWTAVAGLLLVLGGASYAAWGVWRFDPRADPRDNPGFDRPVANLAFLYERYERRLRTIRPETSTEKVLMEGMSRGMNFTAGLLMTLLRLFLGTLTLLSGLVMLTVFVERRRLLVIIGQLASAQDTASPSSVTDP